MAAGTSRDLSPKVVVFSGAAFAPRLICDATLEISFMKIAGGKLLESRSESCVKFNPPRPNLGFQDPGIFSFELFRLKFGQCNKNENRLG